ncbi:ABC transporter permease [Paenibacillus sp. FSL R7-0026]|uniref:ABC transporter permease n=1 Tax=Paenibacillus sp. FSL R7-0026 TaxID=2921668 RepID=UPI0030FBD95F
MTGLGKTTAITVLIAYNQYILLRQFIAALNHVEPSVIEAATGVGMSRFQILLQVQVPLAIKPLFTGLRLASVTTIGMATIAAFINAGGLSTYSYSQTWVGTCENQGVWNKSLRNVY